MGRDMLKQKDFETIGIAADLLAQELKIIALNIVRDSADEYAPLAECPNEFTEEPDKGPGFISVGNDTWLPRHLVNARKRQQRNVSRIGENGIVWTR